MLEFEMPIEAGDNAIFKLVLQSNLTRFKLFKHQYCLPCAATATLAKSVCAPNSQVFDNPNQTLTPGT
jgi:hypothetical protein